MKTLAHHILDIAENSINAGAGLIEITVKERPEQDQFVIVISDNGAGMDPESLRQITDPYYTTRKTRDVGMGLALLRQNAEMTGGNISIHSEAQKGTVVEAVFGYHHIDLQPLGDIAGIITMLMTGEKDQEVLYSHQTPNGTYRIDSREIREILGDIPMNSVKIQQYIKGMIQENLYAIKQPNKK